MTTGHKPWTMSDVVEGGSFQETLRRSFHLLKAVCDHADSFAEEKLGHHYVRINNATVEIRGLGRKWRQLDDGFLNSLGNEHENIATAAQHFLEKLERCFERLSQHIDQGLLLRTKYQAAHKVLGVLTNVEQAHAVLLSYVEGVAKGAGHASLPQQADSTQGQQQQQQQHEQQQQQLQQQQQEQQLRSAGAPQHATPQLSPQPMSAYKQMLQRSFEVLKSICDDADKFADSRLGHNYVRVNNRTVDARSLWRKWDRVNAGIVNVSGDQQRNVMNAIEHFTSKLERCRERLLHYIGQGLLLRTKYQAANKVLKVVTDVEQAHAVLLAYVEGLLPQARQHGAPNQALHQARGQQLANAALPQQHASRLAVQQQELQSGSPMPQQRHMGHSPAQLLQNDRQSHVLPVDPSVELQQQQQQQQQQQAVTQPNAVTVQSQQQQQQPAAVIANTTQAGRSGSLQHSSSAVTNGSDESGDGYVNRGIGPGHDVGAGMIPAHQNLNGHAGLAAWRQLGTTSPQGSPGNNNPLAKSGFVVHIPEDSPQKAAAAAVGNGAPAAPHVPPAVPSVTEVRSGGVALQSAYDINGVPGVAEPLVVGPDGCVQLGAQRYMVVWGPPSTTSTGARPNAYLVPVPQQQIQMLGMAGSSIPGFGGHVQQPVHGLSFATPTSSSGFGGGGSGQSSQVGQFQPDGPGANVQPVERGPISQQQQPPSLHHTSATNAQHAAALPATTLSHLASASLSAEAARQLLACYSPFSATAALEGARRHASLHGSPSASSPTRRNTVGGPPTRDHHMAGGKAVVGTSGVAAAAVDRSTERLEQSNSGKQHAHVLLAAAATADPAVELPKDQAVGWQGQKAGVTTWNPTFEVEPPASRRSLWMRLPPPSNATRPRVGSAAMAGARGTRPPAEHSEASEQRVRRLLDTFVAPASSTVRQSLLLSKVARGREGSVEDWRGPGYGTSRDGMYVSSPSALYGQQEQIQSRAARHSYGGGGPWELQYKGWPAAGTAGSSGGARGASASGSADNATGGSHDQWRRDAEGAGHATPTSQPADTLRSSAPAVNGHQGLIGDADAARQYAAELSQRAEQGDMWAVEELGRVVRGGLPGLPAQPEVARGLLMYAAEAGSSSACHALAEMYERGEGGHADEQQAEAWHLTGLQLAGREEHTDDSNTPDLGEKPEPGAATGTGQG